MLSCSEAVFGTHYTAYRVDDLDDELHLALDKNVQGGAVHVDLVLQKHSSNDRSCRVPKKKDYSHLDKPVSCDTAEMIPPPDFFQLLEKVQRDDIKESRCGKELH